MPGRKYRTVAAAIASAALLGCDAVSVRRAKSRSELDGASFGKYVRDFGRDFKEDSEEFQHRAQIFEASLAQVAATNARNVKEGRLWKAGVHPFMDWTGDERKALNGYKPNRGARKGAVSFLNTALRGMAHMNATAYEDVAGTSGGLDINSGPPIRNQGNCGSCWAISAAEAMEAQLLRSGAGTAPRVSAQALVDCVPNPQHCGGAGGCDGATGELAYAWVRDHGIPLENDLPYTGKTQQCPQSAGLWQASSRVRVSGWDQLPSNKAQPLMQALVEKGPVVVSVDGNDWFNYESGIFDNCAKDAMLGHAVLAKGYSKDDAGNKYWLIQNSWGASWGESGHIRLLRHDDEDNWCGTDKKPQEGSGCDGGPSEITVCGTCGLLYEPLVPSDVHIESGF